DQHAGGGQGVHGSHRHHLALSRDHAILATMTLMASPINWRAAANRRGLEVTDLADHVGTEIGGLFLGDEHDAEIVAIIRAACVERTLLLFRGQTELSPAAYLAFAERFGGRADLHSLRHYCLPEHHEIFVVGNVHEQDTRGQDAKTGSPKVGLN